MMKLSGLKVSRQYRWRVQQRLVVLEYAEGQGMAAAARRFGVTGYRRVRPEVVPLIEHARRELCYGAARTRLWLQRVHQVRLAMGTIQRIFRDLGLPRLRRTRKRDPRQLTLFERPEPGDCVQVDFKFVKLGTRWAFQYTALDDCTRFRVLRLYSRLGQAASLAFLAELRRAFPFRIRRLQCDNGAEFPLAFALAVEAAGIRHRYIRPRRPQQNGKVERSRRIDHEEFWSRHGFVDFDTAATALRRWERTYNHERFSLALQGRTPAEKLTAPLPLSRVA